MRVIKLLAACGVVMTTAASAHAQAIDWAKIDGILGRTGAVGGAVHRGCYENVTPRFLTS